jgi:hypothetical protein
MSILIHCLNIIPNDLHFRSIDYSHHRIFDFSILAWCKRVKRLCRLVFYSGTAQFLSACELRDLECIIDLIIEIILLISFYNRRRDFIVLTYNVEGNVVFDFQSTRNLLDQLKFNDHGMRWFFNINSRAYRINGIR